jgi:NAD(P)-dependent dehydrogenase (short-subunit alcohol dehydrogenase family)
MAASFADGAGFEGRAAVITGAGGGMGLQISSDLIALGADVLMLDIKDDPGVPGGPGRAVYCQLDLIDENAVGEAMTAFHKETGRLDYLGNIAGLLLWEEDKSVVDGSRRGWDRSLEVNLTAVRNTIRHAVPLMLETGGGAMVHVSSIQCMRGDPAPQDAYQAAKAGVLALSRSIAIQYAAKGIRSNAILPGVILTPMQARLDNDRDMRDAAAAMVPLGRLGTPQDLANACLFLLSDLAGYITGVDLTVDGGLMVLPPYGIMARQD